MSGADGGGKFSEIPHFSLAFRPPFVIMISGGWDFPTRPNGKQRPKSCGRTTRECNMKKSEIRVGGLYAARVGGRHVTVRVDSIGLGGLGSRQVTSYAVTNLATGRKTMFQSAAKFRSEVKQCEGGYADIANVCMCGKQRPTDAESCTTCLQEAVAKYRETTTSKIGYHGEEADPMRPESEEVAKLLAADILAGNYQTDPPVSTEDGVEILRKIGEGEQCPNLILVPTVALGGNARANLAATTAPVKDERCSDPTESAPAQSAAACIATVPAPTTAQTDLLPYEQDEEDYRNPPPVNLAARIASARSLRVAGTPVAGMVPNAEQESIIALAGTGPRVMVVGAGAGTGKTATLKMLEQVLPGKGQYTAFNKSLVEDGKKKFVKASVHTTHALAFREVGKQYAHRLGGERVKSYQIARILGIQDLTVTLRGMGAPDEDGKPTDKVKTLRADYLAGQVTLALRKFCGSADREVGEQHFHYIAGIEAATDGDRRWENNIAVRRYLLPYTRKAWEDMSRVDGMLPFTHDCYVKIWQLGQGTDRPVIAADYILLDEAQDTAPVVLDVLKQQTHAMLVFVGDSNQAIYEWRGAVDAMRAYPDAERRLLSQSYRFGQAVADVANAILATLDEPTDLVMRGMPTIPSRVAGVAEPRCYLYRTNAGAVGRVMQAIDDGKRPHLIGGGDDVVRWCQAAADLQGGRGTRHPELACFDTWGEVVEYSKTDEGGDLKLMVKLVDEFGAEAIRDAIKNMPTEPSADLVVSTAHKSKGREWDTVRLGPDFPTANRMSDPDRRLLYVAATRAKLVLDVSECPPFCGAEDRGETGCEERRSVWVPGLRITYTQPMPTEADLAAYRAGTPPYRPAAAQTPLAPLMTQLGKLPPAVAVTAPASGDGGAAGEFSWANMDGGWCVRGPGEAKLGARVTVVRKNGSKSVVTLCSVTRKIGDLWFYGV